MRVGVYKPVGSHLMSMPLPHTLTILTLSTCSVYMCVALLWLNSVLQTACYMLRHCCMHGKVVQHTAVAELHHTLSHTVVTAVTAVTAAAAVTITVTVRVKVTAAAPAKTTAATAATAATVVTAVVLAATAVPYKMIYR
jgi:hypothetical protein